MQITADHSLVAERVRAGLITEAEASHSRQRNVITRTLGANLPVEVDIFTRSLSVGDAILLCSDGLYTMVPDPEIAHLADSHDPQLAVQQLIRRANQLGGVDNIGVALARVNDFNRMSAQGHGHA